MEKTGFATAEDGARIWYGTAGSGPPLVLSDGLACDGFIWPYLIDQLVDRFTVVRWHYRGHGQSDDPLVPEQLTVESLADDLSRVLDALALDSVALAGHSLGVQVILQYAADHPGSVQGLIPICGSYKHPLDTFKQTDVLKRALPYLDSVAQWLPEASQSVWETLAASPLSNIIGTATETNLRLMGARDLSAYLDHVSKMDVQVFLKLLANAAEHSTEGFLGGIQAPSLVIAGEGDTFTPMYRSEEMADLLPDSRLLVIPGGTHVAPLEAPDLVGEEIERFCRNLWAN